MHIVQCGYPRSGSTLLHNMLRSTVQGYRFYEREVPALWVIDEPGDKITKDPKDVFNWREIREKDSEAKFIVTVRDPRSVLCSKHKNTGDLYKVHWDFTWKRLPRKHALKKRRTGDTHNGLLAWHYALMSVPADVVVRYEDLVTDPDFIQRRIGVELGLSYEGRFADFYRSEIPRRLAHQLNGVRAPETSRVASWRQHPERIREQFTACPELFDILIELGYEKDRAWFQSLTTTEA